MALKVELKPNERIIIGACVITNTDQRARLLIDGDKIPILREKDILTPDTADTPAKLIYLAVQLMYLSPDPMAHHPTYFSLVRDILSAMPSAWPFIEGINNHILNGDVYHALKEAKKLIGHEELLLQSARDRQARRADVEAGPGAADDDAQVHHRFAPAVERAVHERAQLAGRAGRGCLPYPRDRRQAHRAKRTKPADLQHFSTRGHSRPMRFVDRSTATG